MFLKIFLAFFQTKRFRAAPILSNILYGNNHWYYLLISYRIKYHEITIGILADHGKGTSPLFLKYTFDEKKISKTYSTVITRVKPHFLIFPLTPVT